ncbi:MAG TPA: periplasmic heavy metal sensor [Verrucomicrobiae bacterium]|nr:periplasmic heavy metal sensor [Verrucomicrobiae bacterium]
MKTFFYSIIVSVLLPGFTLLSSAQESHAPRNFERGVPPRGIRSMAPGQRLMSVLTPEQRASFRKATMAQRDKTRQLQQRLRSVRQELFAEALRSKVNEKAIRQRGAEVGKIEGELAVLRARTFSKIQPPLSHDQIQRLKRTTSEMRPFRAGPPRGAGPRGRAPRRDANDLPAPPRQ